MFLKKKSVMKTDLDPPQCKKILKIMVKKVWTFMSDLPILLEIVQIFFSKKIWRQLTLPTYDLAYVLNFVVFFWVCFLNGYIPKAIGALSLLIRYRITNAFYINFWLPNATHGLEKIKEFLDFTKLSNQISR